MANNLLEILTHPYLPFLFPFLVLLFAFRRLQKPTLNLPPCPPPLPIVGNLQILGELPHLSFHNLSKKYGPLIQVYLGQMPTVITCDADTAAEVLQSQDLIFCSRTQLASFTRFTYGGKDLAFSPFNDHWKQVRRLCNAEVFNLRRVESFHSIRRDEVDALVATIARTSSLGEPVNVTEMVFCYFNNLIFREVFGARVSADGECGSSPFRSLLREVIGAMSELGMSDLCPSMGWVDVLTGWHKKLDKVFAKMDLMFEEKIRERVRMKGEGKHGDGDGHEDFLDVLLNLRDNEDDSSLAASIIKGVLMVRIDC